MQYQWLHFIPCDRITTPSCFPKPCPACPPLAAPCLPTTPLATRMMVSTDSVSLRPGGPTIPNLPMSRSMMMIMMMMVIMMMMNGDGCGDDDDDDAAADGDDDDDDDDDDI